MLRGLQSLAESIKELAPYQHPSELAKLPGREARLVLTAIVRAYQDRPTFDLTVLAAITLTQGLLSLADTYPDVEPGDLLLLIRAQLATRSPSLFIGVWRSLYNRSRATQLLQAALRQITPAQRSIGELLSDAAADPDPYLRDAIEAALPADRKLRRIWEGLYLRELTQAELAEEIGVTERTVRNRLQKLNQHLRRELGPVWAELKGKDRP